MAMDTHNNVKSSVNPVQKSILTVYLSLKAVLAGAVLLLSDAVTLLKSAVKVAGGKLTGVRESPNVVQWHGIPSVLNIPADANLDFNFWRKPTYIVPTLAGMVKIKLRWLLEEKRVEVIPDDYLMKWVTHGPLSRLAAIDGQQVQVDFSVIDQLTFDEDAFLTAGILRFELGNPSSLSIEFTNGERYTPADGAHWALAKLHMQAVASFIIPGRFHGNIHLGLPCAAAASLYRLNKKGALYQLLAPHLRFTLRINNEALRVQRSLDRSKAYAPFPMEGADFAQSIADDTVERTIQPGLRAPHWSLATEALPYNQFGDAYYQVIRRFVQQVLAEVDAVELNAWSNYMAAYIPNFLQADAAEAITTLIWQVSVLHSADHYTFEFLLLSERYSFNKIRLKTPAQSGIRADLPEAQLIDLACDPEDRYRSNVFVATFVRGHKHPLWSNTMNNLSYRFTAPALKLAAESFQRDLLATEQQLEQKHLNLCPLNHVFQSICW
ncbi:hypothetical protein ACQUQU_04935 [Thalassolituus sp. LLYu03]|uniref:hypothetical protein n=1 Tax=Thalassolituus sp. LLYu03 TaxID=3421656 RepID=UPI003D2D9631